jgi:ribosomal-protein-alanine N-acetyltransferase
VLLEPVYLRGATSDCRAGAVIANPASKMTTDSNIILRKTVTNDLDILFAFQLDQDANYLAAFTSKDPTDKVAYLQKQTKFLNDRSINMMTIMIGENIIVGSIAKFEMEGEAELTYWIDKTFWGKGIATKALKNFLTLEITRPIFARAAFDNFGSQKVLEKCGFVRVGQDRGFANARQTEVEEYIYKLA